GKSWCSFSGLNDDPGAPLDGSGPNGPGGQSQSFGQDVKLGLADPHGFNPGLACNPNKTPLGPNPNRTKCGLGWPRPGRRGQPSSAEGTSPTPGRTVPGSLSRCPRCPSG